MMSQEVDDEGQQNKGGSSGGSNKRAKSIDDMLLDEPSSSNKDSKLTATAHTTTLDQQQLDSIGYDRVKLEAFQKQLDAEIEKIGASDLDKRDQYVKLLGKVEYILDVLNNKLTATMPDAETDSSDDDNDDEVDSNNALAGLPDIVRAQITKANRRLRRLSSIDTEDPTLVAVRAALSTGRVKPFFHTLFLPETLLNSRRSFDVVTAGQVDENRQMKFDHDADNLDEVVIVDESGNGKGAGRIIDDGMASNWRFSRKQTAFAVELVNTDAQMLGNDIECTTLTAIPLRIMTGDKSTEVLTRPESRGVVSDIFHQLEKYCTAAITGCPGIGKSWTLFYALQQALIYDGATVLFFFQKRQIAVMYLRRDNKIYAWTSIGNEFANSNLFRRSDVLVLLDPKEASQRGARYASGNMKLVYAASNNEGHFTDDAAKAYGNFITFLGPPLDGELNVILARLNPSLKQDVIEDRKKQVGNLIRYLLSEEKCTARKDAIDYAVASCNIMNPALIKQTLRDKGMSDCTQTISGTLFQVLPTRPDDPNRLGYDGHRVQYRKRVVLAINDSVREAICRLMDEKSWGKSQC